MRIDFSPGVRLLLLSTLLLARMNACVNQLHRPPALGLGYAFFDESFGPLAFAGMPLGVGLNA